MSRQRAIDGLGAGEPQIGWFTPSGRSNEDPGVLTWAEDHGAKLELLETAEGWSGRSNPDPYTVHGYLRDGLEVSLFGCWDQRRDLMQDQILIVRSPTLGVGEHTAPRDRWPRAVFASHNLDQWRPASGFSLKYPRDEGRPQRFEMAWDPPPADEVPVRGAVLQFATSPEVPPYAFDVPVWRVEAHQRLIADARKGFTLADARRRYGEPLLALTSFAVNRPDALIREVLVDLPNRRQIEVWRSGRFRGLSSWRPERDRALFRADQLPDLRRAIRCWWRLYEKVWPALGLFAQHVFEGQTYSPHRFLTLFSAVEAYSRERHGHKDLKKLRTYADVGSDLLGTSNRALNRIGASRRYFAHRSVSGAAFSVSEIEESAVISTRRLEGLFQACLLRELGFSKTKRRELLEDYYAGWPLA